MNYIFEIIERPAIQIAGLTVQTDMVNAGQDCLILWQKYCSYLDEIGAQQNKLESHESYGVSVMQNEKQFIYWAANEYTAQDVLPVEFQVMTLPGGVYVRCEVPNLTQIGDAFTAMYMQWPQTQEQYVLDIQAPFFEVYCPQWAQQDPIMIYARTKPKTT